MRSLDMKYSVLMPVYRKENPFYFYRAALSMMKQSVSPDEFVLVCDGPLTEELDAVIRKLEETWSEQVKIVRLPENRGIGPALAAGVESCRNNLIARMDSDDIACPERCEKQLVQFRGNPALALASGAIAEFEMDSLEKAANMQWTIDTPKEPVEIPEDCCITGTRTLPCGYEEILIFARKRNPMNHMAVMMRRDAVLAVGNYRAVKGAEDYELWVRMLQAGYRAENLPDVLVYARTGNGMMQRRGGLSFLGLGIQPPTPEWGAMLSNARVYIRDAWHVTVIPGLGIMLTILSLNLMGDGLRDAMDPKLKN